MKFRALLLLLFGVFFAQAEVYDLYITSPGAEFSYVTIIAVSDTTYVPWVGGQYVGFKNAEGYNDFGTWETSKPSNTYKSKGVDFDTTGYANSYFVVEMQVLNEAGGYDMIAYTDYMSYEALANARHSLKSDPVESAVYAPLTNSRSYAVPEPASSLLFLVGGALIGLRRKRRQV